jgi:hypothetical protein
MQLIALKQKMGMLGSGTQLNNKALGAGKHAEDESLEIEEVPDETKPT